MRTSLFKLIISIAVLGAAMSFRTIPDHHMMIHFRNAIGDKNLGLDTATYKNGHGQNYNVTMFKYYISNISLTDSAGQIFEQKNSYYLINEDDAGTKDIDIIGIPAGNFKSISFMIGVDSLHNCSGAQSGALDPINGMFWTWNSGYIFMKLEGKSNASKQPGHVFEYHIGGYKAPADCIRRVTMDLTAPGMEPNMVGVNNTGDSKSKMKIADIYINTDVAKIMDSKASIDISKLSSVTDFHNAPAIADNYATMFSLLNIKYDF